MPTISWPGAALLGGRELRRDRTNVSQEGDGAQIDGRNVEEAAEVWHVLADDLLVGGVLRVAGVVRSKGPEAAGVPISNK